MPADRRQIRDAETGQGPQIRDTDEAGRSCGPDRSAQHGLCDGTVGHCIATCCRTCSFRQNVPEYTVSLGHVHLPLYPATAYAHGIAGGCGSPPAILQRGESYAAQLEAQRRIYLHLALLPIFVHGAKAVSAQQAGKSIGLALFSADPGVPVGWPQR